MYGKITVKLTKEQKNTQDKKHCTNRLHKEVSQIHKEVHIIISKLHK